MKLSMKSLAALLMMLNGAVMASENVNTPENRQFLKQQESFSMNWSVNSRLLRRINHSRVPCILCRFPYPKRG